MGVRTQNARKTAPNAGGQARLACGDKIKPRRPPAVACTDFVRPCAPEGQPDSGLGQRSRRPAPWVTGPKILFSLFLFCAGPLPAQNRKREELIIMPDTLLSSCPFRTQTSDVRIRKQKHTGRTMRISDPAPLTADLKPRRYRGVHCRVGGGIAPAAPHRPVRDQFSHTVRQ
jgi:hypothetical protein